MSLRQEMALIGGASMVGWAGWRANRAGFPMAPRSIALPQSAIARLDLTPLQPLRSLSAAERFACDGQLHLGLDWPRDSDDPRELSEVPELRLWHLRADAACPWLPLLLERGSGQLVRYVAMLVLHRFTPSEGLQLHPNALELWLTQRLMLLDDWCRSNGLRGRRRMELLAAALGLDIDQSFWDLLDLHPGQSQADSA